MDTPESVPALSADGLPGPGLPGPAPMSCYSADLERDLVSPAAAEPPTCSMMLLLAGSHMQHGSDICTTIIKACGVQLKQHGGPIQFLEQRYNTDEHLAAYAVKLYTLFPLK